MKNNTPRTFSLESFARNNMNYLARMVDRDSLPYFNIFWSDPAEAAHDWPDFGDVMARQLQAAVMARHMTGAGLPIEKIWLEKIVGLLDPDTGLLVRPATGFSERVADYGDQALTLFALVTACLDGGDQGLEDAVQKMCRTLCGRLGSGFETQGFAIKSLMTCARRLNSAEALEAAGAIVRKVFGETQTFAPNNTFRHGGHMHGNLRTLVGAADYALFVKDPVLYSRVDALYRYVRSTATRFGFLPEVIGRTGDVVACETCALMDYVGLAVTLACHGHPEYWGDVERLVRNQLAESQLQDGSWLAGNSSKEDTEQFSWRGVGERMAGGYAGWSSPNHILACREDLHWGGPELRGKTRAFQNCCGGSGTHAFFIAWKNASLFRDGCLTVNLHMDKLLPQAEIRCFQPYRGLLTVALREACAVRVRIPDFTEAIEVASGADAVEFKAWGNYIELGPRRAGETIAVRYALPVTGEEAVIGNPGGRKYRYRVTWKGDTVVRMEPVGNDFKTGYSDFDNREVPVYYGEEGPGKLYQREYMLEETEPELADIAMDRGEMNFWNDLAE